MLIHRWSARRGLDSRLVLSGRLILNLVGALLLGALLLARIAPTSGHIRQADSIAYSSISIGGAFTAVATSGSFVYAAEGVRFAIFDASDPHILSRRGSLPLSTSIVAIKVVGTQAYVATRRSTSTTSPDNQLFIIDVSNPAAPTILSATPLGKAAQSLDVANNRVYVGVDTCCFGTTAQAALRIFDATDPTSPTLRGEFTTANLVRAVQVVGSRAYLIHDRSFSILDITAAPPALLGSHTFSYANTPQDMAVAGDYAYVTASPVSGALVFVLDLRVPSAIQVADSLEFTRGTRKVAVSGDRAYLASTSYGNEPDGLQVVDISDPFNIALIGGLSGADRAVDIAVANTTVYLARSSSGLSAYDASVPATITEQATYVQTGAPTSLDSAGNLAYVADQMGIFRVIDIGGATPAVLGSLKLDGLSVEVISHTAYLLAPQGLHIVDVTNPAQPAKLSTFPFTAARQFTIKGQFAYVTSGISPTLSIIDISQPHTPTLRAHYTDRTIGAVYDIKVAGDTAYLGNYKNGIAVLDIHDLDAITEVGGYIGGYVPALALDGSTAYTLRSAASTYSLDIVDVSSPVSPTLLARYDLNASPRSIAVAQGTAYIVTDRVIILDVRNPAQPTLRGTIPTAGNPSQIRVQDSRLLVAEDFNGFSVVTLLDESMLPAVSTSSPASIDSSSAILGGAAAADGGTEIVARGVVYALVSINVTPTLSGTGVLSQAMGQGTGAFSSTVAGLQPGVTYAVRAYATNAAGTSYGETRIFTTGWHRIFIPLVNR